MRIVTLIIGAAIGYVLGARAGREKYEAIRAKAAEVWDNPETQARVNKVTAAVKEKAPAVADFIEKKTPAGAHNAAAPAAPVAASGVEAPSAEPGQPTSY